jgi:hypothetical protein
MTKIEYATKMAEHSKQFDEIWTKIVQDTNIFISENGKLSEPIGNIGKVESFIDNLCLSGAWVEDRLNGYSGLPAMNSYKLSRTKKIRKALGYNL